MIDLSSTSTYQKISISDISQEFNQIENLSVNVQGDLQTVSRETLTIQRILRRLLTNPGELLAHPEYGAGIKQYIGQILTIDEFDAINSNITSQILMEASVAQNPAPVTVLSYVGNNVINADITYTSAFTNQPYSFSFQITS